MVSPVRAGAVELDVVGGAQNGNGVVGDGVPVLEELRRGRAEEEEPGNVDGARREIEHGRVDGLAEAVGREDVEALVAHVGRRGDGVEDLLHALADSLLARTAAGCCGGRRGADQVEQVGSLGLVEMQGAGDALEHVVGDAVGVPALESRVVP